MMESKVAVYAVLAVALGYLLVSVVPNQLTVFQEEMRQAGTEERESLGVDEAKPIGEEPKAAADEAKITAEGAKTYESVEPMPAAPRGIWDGAVALGVWVINLLVALGVYFAVRRHLS